MEHDSARQLATELFRAGVAAAEPSEAVRRSLRVVAGRLELAGPDDSWHAPSSSRIHAIAFGKAACGMARALAAVRALESWRGPGLAITYHGNVEEVDGFEVVGSGHPLPDAAGVAAGARVRELALSLDEEDLLLVLISGGGSALLPAPATGLTLDDKLRTTELLLASGAGIHELNAVRKHLSYLKGGGLARLAAPARVHGLLLSDVIGDDPSTIASGPIVPDPTTFADVRETLVRRDVLERVPPGVRARIDGGCRGEIEDTPPPDHPAFRHVTTRIVGGNTQSLRAVERAARARGGDVRIVSEALCGEARAEAAALAAEVKREVEARREIDRPVFLLAGGETTVRVTGSGKGGRNQELALAFALEAERVGGPGDWVFLSGGTDGRDGPTDAAGGIVDPHSLERMRRAGVNPAERLTDNDAYRALESSGDLLRTGPTGTNVADLQIVVVRPRASDGLG